MILTAVHVEHWSCIGKLDLTDLPAGIVVLHGPNQTGKSSLVRALRACLFDADHNSQSAEIKASVPRGGRGVPKVVVEFQTNGDRHRLTKVFSKNKDGTALLERLVGDTWKIEERAPKEASRKARELLGTDRSDTGLNQLLWLSQGEVTLPETKELDTGLEKQLADVLGSMLTGRDLEFEQELRGRLGRWFSATGKDLKNSKITKGKEQIAKLNEELGKVQAKYEELGRAIRRLEECADLIPEARKLVSEAEEERNRLETDRQRCSQRVNEYERARHLCDLAGAEHSAAIKALKDFQEAGERLAKAERDVNRAENDERTLLAERTRLAELHVESLAALTSAEEAVLKHGLARGELDDLEKFLDLRRRIDDLAAKRDEAIRLTSEYNALEDRIAGIPSCDEKSINEMRVNRRQAGELRARLEVSALRLSITAEKPLQVVMAFDNGGEQSTSLAASKTHELSFRQHAVVHIPGVARLELGRGREDLDLEKAAKEIEQLDSRFSEVLSLYEGTPPDESGLDRLAEQRFQRIGLLANLEESRKRMSTLAPQGTGALSNEMARLQSQCATLQKDCPILTMTAPTAADLEQRKVEFGRRAKELEARCTASRIEEITRKRDLESTDKRLNDIRADLSGLRAMANAVRGELGRMGEVSLLAERVQTYESALAEAQAQMTKAELTPEERSVEADYKAAAASYEERLLRLQSLEQELSHLRGVLHGNEGIHTQMADAESQIHEAEKELAREELDASAYRRLTELFDQCRENQVVQVMQPIADRVLGWARKLGLDEYQKIDFGDSYLPQEIVVGDGQPSEPIHLEAESYGTGEQLSLLVRLALGGILAQREPAVAILDDPLAHADPVKHRRMLDIIRLAAEGDASAQPPAGRLQVLILTCHPERFESLSNATQIDLGQLIGR